MTNGEPVTPWGRFGWWCVIAAACLLQAYEIRHRGIDPDELEHLHAGYCVASGQVPYRDFFEHHAPALYYLIWPLFKLYGPSLAVLWSARCLMFGCSLATLWLAGQLACHWRGERAGLIAGALLAWTTVFHAKGIELRPDVPAMLLLALAAVVLVSTKEQTSYARLLGIGVLCGLALLFTQKSIVPAAGIGVAACLVQLMSGPSRMRPFIAVARVGLFLSAGAIAVWGIASLLFAMAGAAGDFWHGTWYQLWVWPIRSSRWDYLRPTLAGDLTVWGAAGIDLAIVVSCWRRAEVWNLGRAPIVVISAVCIASVPFVKATYPQFYLLWMPFLAALAGSRIVSILDALAKRNRVISFVVIVLSLAMLHVALWHRAFLLGFSGPLPRLAESASSNAPVLIAMSCVVFGAVVLAWRRRWRPACLFACAIGMTYGILRNLDLALWSNDKQVATIEAIHRQILPEGRVLDGFTGLAALRRHAWYYWWINEYSLALVPESERERGLLEQLQSAPPAAVLWDRNIGLLPRPVVDWLKENYETAEPPPLWLPKPANDR
jgi:hypothetical protein